MTLLEALKMIHVPQGVEEPNTRITVCARPRWYHPDILRGERIVRAKGNALIRYIDTKYICIGGQYNWYHDYEIPVDVDDLKMGSQVESVLSEIQADELGNVDIRLVYNDGTGCFIQESVYLAHKGSLRVGLVRHYE
jgi:hypothetical protein